VDSREFGSIALVCRVRPIWIDVHLRRAAFCQSTIFHQAVNLADARGAATSPTTQMPNKALDARPQLPIPICPTDAPLAKLDFGPASGSGG
jgi:hypothetical protein